MTIIEFSKYTLATCQHSYYKLFIFGRQDENLLKLEILLDVMGQKSILRNVKQNVYNIKYIVYGHTIINIILKEYQNGEKMLVERKVSDGDCRQKYNSSPQVKVNSTLKQPRDEQHPLPRRLRGTGNFHQKHSAKWPMKNSDALLANE